MLRVKICGITNSEDAALATGLGAAALGFIFVEASPRFVPVAVAATIAEGVPPFVSRVGVFAGAGLEEIIEVAGTCGLDTVQLHGYQQLPDPALLRRAGLRVVQAVQVKDEAALDALSTSDIESRSTQFTGPDAYLLDSYKPGLLGGTGEVFDWKLALRAKSFLRRPMILAGGMRPENIVQAASTVLPFAVDVCSGVEAAPGKKDPVRLRALFSALYEERWRSA